MKRRIGKYKGKILVEGDKNLLKPYENHIDNLGGGSTNLIKEYYYKLKSFDFIETLFFVSTYIHYSYRALDSKLITYSGTEYDYIYQVTGNNTFFVTTKIKLYDIPVTLEGKSLPFKMTITGNITERILQLGVPEDNEIFKMVQEALIPITKELYESDNFD